MRSLIYLISIVSIIILLFYNCNNKGPTNNDIAPDSTIPYFPLSLGNVWIYQNNISTKLPPQEIDTANLKPHYKFLADSIVSVGDTVYTKILETTSAGSSFFYLRISNDTLFRRSSLNIGGDFPWVIFNANEGDLWYLADTAGKNFMGTYLVRTAVVDSAGVDSLQNLEYISIRYDTPNTTAGPETLIFLKGIGLYSTWTTHENIGSALIFSKISGKVVHGYDLIDTMALVP